MSGLVISFGEESNDIRKKDLVRLLKKLEELHKNRKDYSPNKATEDFDFLCGYVAALYCPSHAEPDIQNMIEKYL